MRGKIVLGESFMIDVSHDAIKVSYACDMQHCMLARAAYIALLKFFKAGSFSVSAIASGIIIEMDGKEHEYCFDRLTLLKITNFDQTYENAIAAGLDEEQAHLLAQAAMKPFKTKATFIHTRSRRIRTQADVERQADRKRELAVGRHEGSIPLPTPRPARAKRTGRRVIRMGFASKRKVA